MSSQNDQNSQRLIEGRVNYNQNKQSTSIDSGRRDNSTLWGTLLGWMDTLSTSDYRPVTYDSLTRNVQHHSRRISTPSTPELPSRPIPSNSSLLLHGSIQQRLQQLQANEQRRLDAALNRNARKQASLNYLNKTSKRTQSENDQALSMELYEPMQNLNAETQFRQQLNPANTTPELLGMHQKDYHQFVQHPFTTADYLQRLQASVVAQSTHPDPLEMFISAQHNVQQSKLLPKVSATHIETSKEETKPLYLTPEIAYLLIQSGKYSEVKNQKVSKYYTWNDVLNAPYGNTSPMSNGAVKSVPLSSYQNAAILALGLDKLSAAAGKKLTINTWIRWNDGGHHETGKAADIGNMLDPTINYSYIRSVLLPFAQRIPEFRGVGYPTKSTQNSLHLDIGGHRAPIPYGQQFVFVDNGDGHYPGSIQKVIKPYL